MYEYITRSPSLYLSLSFSFVLYFILSQLITGEFRKGIFIKLDQVLQSSLDERTFIFVSVSKMSSYLVDKNTRCKLHITIWECKKFINLTNNNLTSSGTDLLKLETKLCYLFFFAIVFIQNIFIIILNKTEKIEKYFKTSEKEIMYTYVCHHCALSWTIKVHY